MEAQFSGGDVFGENVCEQRSRLCKHTAADHRHTLEEPRPRRTHQYVLIFAWETAGKYNVLQVTGVVRLALPGDDDKTLAVCMLSHARLAAKSTLGAASKLWIARGGLRDVIDLILSLLKFEEEAEEEKRQLAKTRLSTVWPTAEQRKGVLKAVRAQAAHRDFDFGGDMDFY